LTDNPGILWKTISYLEKIGGNQFIEIEILKRIGFGIVICFQLPVFPGQEDGNNSNICLI